MKDIKNDLKTKQPNFFEYNEFLRIKKIYDENTQLHQYWSFTSNNSITYNNTHYPLWEVSVEDKHFKVIDSQLQENKKNSLIISAGVHGLERIGSQLCLSLLEKYLQLSLWDSLFLNSLKNIKIIFIPFVNPVGIAQTTRSNGHGIDLMRNAPINAEDKVPFLAGGHRFGKWLPWYRGEENTPMEIESQFLINTVEKHVQSSQFSISLDIHSGLGFQDQIWFPWAFTKRPFNQLGTVTHLITLFEKIFPFHIYKIEPQSQVYCAHGDLWDYLLCEPLKNSHYLPLTLELGSWLWIKKNPFQIFNFEGLFHPIKKHRIKRTLRRHQLFIDFLIRYLYHLNNQPIDQQTKEKFYNEGLDKWYPQIKKI